jgi:predicted RNA-binding Zn ribbon-like protein
MTPGPNTPAALPMPAPPEDLCLSFANTRSWRGSEAPTERLHDIDDVVAWCRSEGGFPSPQAEAWRTAWHDRPTDGDAALGEAIRLREAIYRTFHAVASAGAPAEADLDGINRVLAGAPPRAGVAATRGGFAWRVALPDQPSVAALLAPVVWSAAALLVGPRLARVRQCANERCLWVFLDDSKSGTRRWCSMSSASRRRSCRRISRNSATRCARSPRPAPTTSMST